ncbi:MAG: hypothetical protein A2163_09525 [Actinobacteria bacterium RBG_13_35_12]|nr:MAG: hypothetical protein A2163_09525 [Actinobacteria bacterium RBG_13_35_12]
MRKVINFQLIIIFVVLVFISFYCIGYTAGEILTWNKTFGGIEADMANSIIQTEDGGYALAGYTWSKGAGRQDFWVIKLYEDGSIEWDRTFGGSEADVIYSIIQTKDKGYAVAGKTKSIASGEKAWVIKLNTRGNKEWDNTFAKRTDDEIFSIIQTQDGGYTACGYTGDKEWGEVDSWIIKLDETLNIEWDKIFGGIGWDEANSILQAEDGSFIIFGFVQSKDKGREDGWVTKLDENGEMVWDKAFGGSQNDEIFSGIKTTDGGYAVCGFTESKGAGREDAWVAKLDENGEMVWDKAFGGIEGEVANSIIQTRDEGYVLAGYTESKGAGRYDAWVIKLDENGEMAWDKTFGGSDEDVARRIIQAEDGGYVLAGYTESKGAGRYDAWVIKLDEKGNLE